MLGDSGLIDGSEEGWRNCHCGTQSHDRYVRKVICIVTVQPSTGLTSWVGFFFLFPLAHSIIIHHHHHRTLKGIIHNSTKIRRFSG